MSLIMVIRLGYTQIFTLINMLYTGILSFKSDLNDSNPMPVGHPRAVIFLWKN